MWSHAVCGVRLMQMLWTWCACQMESLSSSAAQLNLWDASSAPKLWAQMRDTTSHTSTSIQKVLQGHMRTDTKTPKHTHLNGSHTSVQRYCAPPAVISRCGTTHKQFSDISQLLFKLFFKCMDQFIFSYFFSYYFRLSPNKLLKKNIRILHRQMKH